MRVWSFFDCCRPLGDGSFDQPVVDEVTVGNKCHHILYACELHDVTGHSVDEGEPTPRTKAWTAALRTGKPYPYSLNDDVVLCKLPIEVSSGQSP